MIAPEAAVRWAANAPSAALLSAALRGDLPADRVEVLAARPVPDEAAGYTPPPADVRIWRLDGPPVLFKRHVDRVIYHREIANLRFFNVVARLHTPRLLACDGAACALLVEDVGGHTMAAAARLGGPLAARHALERALTVLAAIHVHAGARVELLKRLYAPHPPPIGPLPSADYLHRGVAQACARRAQSPPTRAERAILEAAGAWLHARLALAVAQNRAVVLGATFAGTAVAPRNRIVFLDQTQPPLGLQAADLALAPHWPDRRQLIEGAYLAERARLGSPLDPQPFWELEGILALLASLGRLGAAASCPPGGEETDGGPAACEAAARIHELRALGELLERRGLG